MATSSLWAVEEFCKSPLPGLRRRSPLFPGVGHYINPNRKIGYPFVFPFPGLGSLLFSQYFIGG